MTAVQDRRDDFARRDSAGGRDPLDHWLDQERAGAPDDQLLADPDPGPMPGGWWILPAMALSVPAWGALVWLLAG
jgi:hypothetical protein